METFDFDYHEPVTKYPERSGAIKLGSSYTFVATPTSPPQRTITLYFDTMVNYWDSVNNRPDVTTNPQLNYYRLEQFYQRHETHADFIYVHPQYGQMVVKFAKPLEAPRKLGGTSGQLQGFSIELVEQP